MGKKIFERDLDIQDIRIWLWATAFAYEAVALVIYLLIIYLKRG